MSRIGKQPIKLPAGVDVKIGEREITVTGSRGELRVAVPPRVSIKLDDGTIYVSRNGDSKMSRAMHGLARANLANAVHGVVEGFSKALEIIGTGYKAEMKGKNLDLRLGYSHTVAFEPPLGVDVACESATRIVVSGIDKIKVGQAAADIRSLRPPEPYKGKGIRYVGEHVRRKAGKSAAAAG